MYSQTGSSFYCTEDGSQVSRVDQVTLMEHHGSQWLCCYIHYIVRLYSGPYQDWVLCEDTGVKLVRPAGDGRYWHGSLSYSFTDFQGLAIKYKKS